MGPKACTEPHEYTQIIFLEQNLVKFHKLKLMLTWFICLIVEFEVKQSKPNVIIMFTGLSKLSMTQ